MNWLSTETARRRFALSTLLLITCLLGARGISKESSVMLTGDMARYVMNGVFIRDLIADGGVTSYDALTRYAELYYAKYPALSLGHHPPVPYLSVVPFYWVVGVNLFAARLAALLWFALAVWGLYKVATRLFTWQVAAWTSALFVTNIIVLRFGQYLLSEIPMTALVLWALAMLLQFCRYRRPIHVVFFALLLIASLYAKQLAVMMLPVYAAVIVSQFGWRSFITPRAIGIGAVALILIIPLGMMTIGLAPGNLEFAIGNAKKVLTGIDRDAPVSHILSRVFLTHLSVPALLLSAAGLIVMVVRRRPQAFILLVWIVTMVGAGVVFGGNFEPARYAFGAFPAYFLCIAGLTFEAKSRWAKAVTAALLVMTVGWQVWTIRKVYPSGAEGYETAAVSMLARVKEPTMLYASDADTGYFPFFIRKHDHAQQHVVLRVDKLIGRGTGDPDHDRNALHFVLQELGVRWIVLESVPGRHPIIQMMHQEVRGPRFVERERIPVTSTAGPPGLTLGIYEYLDAKPANYDAEVNFSLPLGQRKYSIRLRDLVSAEPR